MRAVIAAFVLAGTLSQSPPPADTKSSDAPPQQTAGQETASANGSGGIGNVAPGGWGTMIFTGGLLAVAILQWLSYRKQASFMKAGLEETKRQIISQGIANERHYDVAARNVAAAARFAEAAERALAAGERAWLVVDKVHIDRREPAPAPNAWFIGFSFKNVGRVPALCEELIVKVEDVSELPDLPDYWGASTLDCGRSISARDSAESSRIGPAETSRTKDGKAVDFVVYGRITYKSLNGTEMHQTGFAVEVSPIVAAWNACGKKNYEYYT